MNNNKNKKNFYIKGSNLSKQLLSWRRIFGAAVQRQNGF